MRFQILAMYVLRASNWSFVNHRLWPLNPVCFIKGVLWQSVCYGRQTGISSNMDCDP